MRSLIVLLALAAFAPATDDTGVTAKRLDGSAIVGKLMSWDETGVVIGTPHGEERLSTEELLSLDWPAESVQDKQTNAARAEIELVDGSRIPIEGFRSVNSRATATLAGQLPTHYKSLSLARKQLASVRLTPLTAATAQQWREIGNTEFASDVIVLLKRDGKSLDYVEGILGDVSPKKIAFTLDGDTLRIDRAKVAGFIYYRGKNGPDREPRCIVKGRSGLRASVSQASLSDHLLTLTTAIGVTLKWPIDDIAVADFSVGKLHYLSDLEPALEKWTPLVALPAGATLAAEYGRPRRDQSAYGGPLMLRMDASPKQSPLREQQSFHKGLALRSRTELAFRLPDGFARFVAVAGIDPSTSSTGSVRLEIYGDERLLFENSIAGNEPPRAIDLNIAGVNRLRFVVDYGSNLDTGDWLNLCDARIVK